MRGPALALLALAAGCSSPSAPSGAKGAPHPSGDPHFALFVTTELRGTIEPCGCNSDPLGDLARTAALLAAARAQGPVLYVDGGSLLYTANPVPEGMLAQEQLKSALLAGALVDDLHADAVGLGPFDLAEGAAAVKPARQAVNLPAELGVALAPPALIEVGGARVGVFGVVAPEAVAKLGVAGDPAAAARAAVADLRGRGAQVVVVLAHMPRKAARELAKAAPGIDFVVVGQDAPEPDHLLAAAEPVGDAFLVQPANRGQVVTRIDVTLRGAGPLVDAVGEARAQADGAALDARIAKLKADLAEWEKAPDADPGFVAARREELAALEREREALRTQPLRVPAAGSWFTAAQVPIKKALACEPAVQARKVAYDAAAGEANIRTAAGRTAPPPAAGHAGYAGGEECGYCHEEAVKFWRTTRHHDAFQTLASIGKQNNLDCIYCHVTGFGEPGGSTIADYDRLRDVQCEVCHGPASLHVDADGKEKPKSLVLTTPQERCVLCHSAEHSDTFQYEAYLRDVVGKGHGEALRAKLGDGPTGHALRSAALAKAGAAIGAGCPK